VASPARSARRGRIGELRSITGVFSYFNVDPSNIRNQVECGGGALWTSDATSSTPRVTHSQQEPTRVVACIDRDPEMHTDRLTSALLEFPGGHSIFTCSTQLVPYQRIHFLGTRGRIEIEIPFNAPPDRPTRLFIDASGDLSGSGIYHRDLPGLRSVHHAGRRVLQGGSGGQSKCPSARRRHRNMAVIEAIFNSADSGQWEAPLSVVTC
jgi:predicted dehydrogenase